ncbi:MAG: DUF1573 domain-containing protein [bacterium]|nr:DUF1573 domain-containing protein [bacterium]
MDSYKNLLIIFGIVVAVVAGLVLMSRAVPIAGESDALQASVNSTLKDLKVDEIFYNFGNISMAAGKVSHIFRVKNLGSEAVTVSKLYTSCMCTTATLTAGGKSYGPIGMAGHGFVPKINAVVAPGEEITVEAVFDPAAHGPAGVGTIERAVYLEGNPGDTLALQFKTFVTP